MSEPSPAGAADSAAPHAPGTGAYHEGARLRGAQGTGAQHRAAQDPGTRHAGVPDTGARHAGARHAGTQDTGARDTGQPRPAVRARPGILAGAGLALENWRVSWRLIALIVVPTAMGLAFAGLQVSMAERNAQTMARVERLAAAGQAITGLAQAMEDERDDSASFIAHARPAAGLPRLARQYAVTGRWAARVRPLVGQLGSGYPAQTMTDAAAVLSSLARLPALRHDVVHGDAPALTTINGYTEAAATLFTFNDGIAQQSGNFAFANSVRALGSLSRMKDQASQQRAILYTALVGGQFTAADQTALIAARAQQASDLALFSASATAPQSQLRTRTVAGPLVNQAQSIEQVAVANTNNGTALSLGPGAGHAWYADMSYTIGRMRQVEQQLAGSVVSSAQALRSGAVSTVLQTGGAALAALLIVLLITVLIARSMVRPLRRLKEGALDIAETRLPAEVRELSDAAAAGRGLSVRPIDVLSTDEIGQVARAFDQVHREAVRLAGDEARLRSSVSAMFVSLSRRSQLLLERLLRLIDSLELGEGDPERLANLFRMDHLATRMRRNSENLLVLAGHETPRRWAEPVPLMDVLRAASSEIEQYERVVLNIQPGAAVLGTGVADTVHLLAELLENAAAFSPKSTQVVVSGHGLGSGGARIEISDNGMGMAAERLEQLNERLEHPPVADVAVARHMGLFAVAHLAARHHITVRLRPRAGGGTTAEVSLPGTLTSVDQRTGDRPEGTAGAVPRPRGAGYSPPRFAAALASDAARPATAGPGGSPGTTPNVIIPPASGPGQGALPVFDSLESDWFRARGAGPALGEPRTGSPPGGPRSWTSPGDEGWKAAAAAVTPSVGGLTRPLPRRVPLANLVPGSAGDRATRTATMAEAAEIARGPGQFPARLPPGPGGRAGEQLTPDD